jgi:hypothetical protein
MGAINRTAKTLACFGLRLLIYMPLALAGHLCGGLSALFEHVGDGLFDMARATKQITHAPYIRDIEAAVAAAKTRDKERILRELRGADG